MSSQYINIFSYDNVIDLTYSNTRESLENLPMYNRDIKIHRGIESKIHFRVKNHDRKTFSTLGKTLFTYIININTNEVVCAKSINIIDNHKGLHELILSKSETILMQPGLYRMTITTIDVNDYEYPLYSGVDYDVTFNVEVLDNILPPFKESYITLREEWREDDQRRLYTSIFPGDRQLGFTDGLHTIAVYGNNFSGRFYIQASLNNDIPTSELDWSNIQLNTINNYHTFDEFTGIEPFNFQMQIRWIRFLIEPRVEYPKQSNTPVIPSNQGDITKILYRN